MPADSELNIEETVDSMIDDILPGSEPAPPEEPAPGAAPAPVPGAQPASGTPQPVAYPKSWKKDYEPHWGKLPREVQEYVSNVREKDYLDGLEQYKTGHVAWQGMQEVFTPYMARLNSLGLEPQIAVKYLLNAEYTLANGSPEQKLQALQQMAKDYGVDLAKVSAEQPLRTEAEIALAKRLEGMEGQVHGFMQAQHAERRAAIDKDVVTFASDPKNIYFEEVGNDIAQLLLADKKLSLADAYERAVWANPVTRAKEQARTAKEADDKRRMEAVRAAKEAKRSSAGNARGKPTDKETPNPVGTMDDTIRETLAEINSRT